MAFFSRDYEVFLLLAAPDAPPLWNAAQWTPFAASLDGLMAQARGKAGVRSHQYNPKGKPISFGRLGWDEKSHAKWTHTAATTQARFMTVEAWAPTWTLCEKDDQAPDVFLALANESLLGRPASPCNSASAWCAPSPRTWGPMRPPPCGKPWRNWPRSKTPSSSPTRGASGAAPRRMAASRMPSRTC